MSIAKLFTWKIISKKRIKKLVTFTFPRLQTKYGLNTILSESNQSQTNELTDELWEAFQNTAFDSDETEADNAVVNNNETSHDDRELIEINEEQVDLQQNGDFDLEREVGEISGEENNGGTHVGLDEESADTQLNRESDLEREVDEIFCEEDNEGIHVGFDGESDRSEDEPMTAEDRMFLDDEETETKEPTSSRLSHLAFLNVKRYEDDETNLKRLIIGSELKFEKRCVRKAAIFPLTKIF